MSDLSGWQPRPMPGGKTLPGRLVTLEPIDWKQDGPALFAAFSGDENLDLWRWILLGPYADEAEFISELAAYTEKTEAAAFQVRMNGTGAAEGMLWLMRPRPAHGAAEIGAIVFSRRLQRTTGATEAVYLAGRHLMEDCRYRRYEWRCNSLNEASRRAAERFGFTFEGTHRHDFVIMKDGSFENRDTDWLSITDAEWPGVRAAFDAWLDPENFDGDGRQRTSLSDFQQRLRTGR